MKIGILGVPGAGKSKFANDLGRELAGDLGTNEYGFHIVDDYVEALRERTGQEYGRFGNHIDDMQVVFKRLEWERTLRDKDTITVGTVLDSTIHNFIRTDEAAQTRHEVGLQTSRLQTIAATFGMLFTDTWDYDYAFFLPFVPNKKSEGTYGRMSEALAELIRIYRAPVLTLTQESLENEPARVAADAIRALEEEQLPEASERGVRPGGEAGEEERDSSESVPDVPEQGADSHDA